MKYQLYFKKKYTNSWVTGIFTPISIGNMSSDKTSFAWHLNITKYKLDGGDFVEHIIYIQN